MKNEWTTKRLGDVGKTQYGLSESMNEEGKGFKIFRMGEVQEGRLIDTGRMKYADISRKEFEQYKLRFGDVLFNRTNSFELVGKTGIFTLKGDYCFASYLVRLNLDRKKVLPEFANYFMNSDRFQKSVKEKASKSINQANINATILANELIRFPDSLLEQRRIVGILDEAFGGIATGKANAEKNLQNARALFESHLQSVFTERGEGWKDKRLQEVAESISTGPFGTMLHRSDYVPNGIPLVNPMNIVESRIVPSSKMMVNEKTRERLRVYVLKAGDVVIGRRGELGRCALVTKREEGWLCGTGSFILRLSDCMDGRFFVALFGSKQFRARLEGSAVGTTMSSLNHSILNELPIPVPPIAMQMKIMAVADELKSETQRLESLYHRKLAALEALKKSLLHQAFSSEL